MCEHCGCRGVPPIAELMEEHDALLVDAHEVRSALATGDLDEVMVRIRHLATHLDPHVRREERGVFTALREQGEWADEVAVLEREHHDLDAAVEELDPQDADFGHDVLTLLRELEEHIERENLGIFPVSVVTLGAEGWDLVQQAREQIPSFLADRNEAAVADR